MLRAQESRQPGPPGPPFFGSTAPTSEQSMPCTLQVFLSVLRAWLSAIAYVFYLVALCLRLVGNLVSVLSGAFAFTVIIAVVLSLVGAALYIAASGANFVGGVLESIGRATEMARKQGNRVRQFATNNLDHGGSLDMVRPGGLQAEPWHPPKAQAFQVHATWLSDASNSWLLSSFLITNFIQKAVCGFCATALVC